MQQSGNARGEVQRVVEEAHDEGGSHLLETNVQASLLMQPTGKEMGHAPLQLDISPVSEVSTSVLDASKHCRKTKTRK